MGNADPKITGAAIPLRVPLIYSANLHAAVISADGTRITKRRASDGATAGK